MKVERVEKKEQDVVVDETIHIQLTQEELDSFRLLIKSTDNGTYGDEQQKGYDFAQSLLDIFEQ